MKTKIKDIIEKLEVNIEDILHQRKVYEKLDFYFEAKILDVKYNLLKDFKNELLDLIREKGD